MAVYYFQGQQIVAPFVISSNEPVFSADTITLKVRRAKQGAQRWEMEFKVVMDDPAATFSDMVTNFHTPVSFEMPQLNSRGTTISSGSCYNSVTVNGDHLGGENPVLLQGMNPSSTINKGRFIKFTNHDKIYLVTDTCTADSSGNGSLFIYPSLRTSVVDDTALLYRDVTDAITFTGYRDISNNQSITFNDGILSDLGQINIIEAL